MAHVASYIVLVHDAEQHLAASLDTVGDAHATEPEIRHGTRTLADGSRHHVGLIEPLRAQYQGRRDEHAGHEPDAFFAEPLLEARRGPIGLLRDLQDLLVLAAFVQSAWTVVAQGARALHDQALQEVCEQARRGNEVQARWLRTQIKAVAPQVLLLAP